MNHYAHLAIKHLSTPSASVNDLYNHRLSLDFNVLEHKRGTICVIRGEDKAFAIEPQYSFREWVECFSIL